jgi:hypothetical protein
VASAYARRPRFAAVLPRHPAECPDIGGALVVAADAEQGHGSPKSGELWAGASRNFPRLQLLALAVGFGADDAVERARFPRPRRHGLGLNKINTSALSVKTGQAQLEGWRVVVRSERAMTFQDCGCSRRRWRWRLGPMLMTLRSMRGCHVHVHVHVGTARSLGSCGRGRALQSGASHDLPRSWRGLRRDQRWRSPPASANAVRNASLPVEQL